MDAELVSILQNIKSLAEQATQIQGGSAQKAEDEDVQTAPSDLPPEVAEKVLKYLKEMDTTEEGDEDEDENKAEMSEDEDEDGVKKSAEGPTASDDAEARIDEGAGDADEKNINEVAKAIARMLVKKGSKAPAKKTVAKSAEVKELYKVVKALAVELKAQKEFSVNVLKGLGIADSILESGKTEPKAKPMDVNAQEVAKSLEFIKQALGAQPREEASTFRGQDHTIAKSLADGDGALLRSMFPKSAK